MRVLADAISDPARDTTELVPYILHGPEALRVALPQYRIDLGKVTNVRHVKEFIFALQGSTGTSLVEAHREDLAVAARWHAFETSALDFAPPAM